MDALPALSDPYRCPAWYGIPAHMREGLHAYVAHRVPPGDFLMAVLSNELGAAVARADDVNRTALMAYVRWLSAYAPAVCWGSRAHVAAWLAGADG
jgi:hypothetical protein